MSQRRQMIRLEGDEDDGSDNDDDDDRRSQENRTAASSISHEKLAKKAQRVILLDLGAIVYYLVVCEFITTVAHGCAVVMGACLSQLANKHSDVTRASAGASTETTIGTSEEPLLETTNQEGNS